MHQKHLYNFDSRVRVNKVGGVQLEKKPNKRLRHLGLIIKDISRL